MAYQIEQKAFQTDYGQNQGTEAFVYDDTPSTVAMIIAIQAQGNYIALQHTSGIQCHFSLRLIISDEVKLLPANAIDRNV